MADVQRAHKELNAAGGAIAAAASWVSNTTARTLSATARCFYSSHELNLIVSNSSRRPDAWLDVTNTAGPLFSRWAGAPIGPRNAHMFAEAEHAAAFLAIGTACDTFQLCCTVHAVYGRLLLPSDTGLRCSGSSGDGWDGRGADCTAGADADGAPHEGFAEHSCPNALSTLKQTDRTRSGLSWSGLSARVLKVR
jgi:hypothetical protein